MNEDHVVVEEETVDAGEGEDQEDSQVDAHEAVRLLLVVVVVEAEVVSEAPVLVQAVYHEDDEGV